MEIRSSCPILQQAKNTSQSDRVTEYATKLIAHVRHITVDPTTCLFIWVEIHVDFAASLRFPTSAPRSVRIVTTTDLLYKTKLPMTSVFDSPKRKVGLQGTPARLKA